MPHLHSFLARSLLLSVVAAAAFVGLAMTAMAKEPQLEPPGRGEVRALVVGINNYQYEPTLKGAVADARDIAAVLHGAGVKDLTILIDGAASRAAVVSAMRHLITASNAGDLDIISFAGHGAQEPERIKGSEPDGMDEIFVLPGFSFSGGHTKERIIDDEINGWLSKLDRKGVQVIFIADTCHGGGLTRSIDKRAELDSYRSLGTISIADDALKPVSTDADAHLTADSFKHVTFLAAVDKYSKAPEIRINGQFRGALSYAFARAIQGALVGGKETTVTREKLFGYLRQVVYHRSDTRQAIVTEPVSNETAREVPVLRLKGNVDLQAWQISSAPIQVKIENGDDGLLRGIKLDPRIIRIVPLGQWADLIWDASSREAISAFGDVVARDVRAEDLPAVAARTAAINVISQMADRSPQSISLRPNDGLHHSHELVSVHLDGASNDYLVLFNIAGNGTVQFLYPLPQDKPLLNQAQFDLPLQVQEPFGSDCVVAITARQPLTEFLAALKSINGQKTPERIVAALQAGDLAAKGAHIGFADLFTAP